MQRFAGTPKPEVSEAQRLHEAGFRTTKSGSTWSHKGQRLHNAQVLSMVQDALDRRMNHEELFDLALEVHELGRAAVASPDEVTEHIMNLLDARNIELTRLGYQEVRGDVTKALTPDEAIIRVRGLNPKLSRDVVHLVLTNQMIDAAIGGEQDLIDHLRATPNAEAVLDLSAKFVAQLGLEGDEVSRRALLHWMWQIRRRILRLEVHYPLFLTVYGEQGTGKDHTIRRLISPLKGFTSSGTLTEAQEFERNYRKFETNFVVHMEEIFGTNGQGGVQAEQALRNALKMLITRDDHMVRLFHTQNQVRITSRFSGIASTNDGIGTIIGDPTGMRRYYEFCVSVPEGQRWVGEKWSDEDNLKLWRSLDVGNPYGYLSPEADAAAWAQLQDIQSTYRTEPPIDRWASDKGLALAGPADERGDVQHMSDLYIDYQMYCRETQTFVTPRHYWLREMKKRYANEGSGEAMKFFSKATAETVATQEDL